MGDMTGKVYGGRYEITGLLGRGGMAAVYKAHDSRLGRDVALKVITVASGEHGREFLARFDREARSLAQLNHPNIVKVHDYGEEDGTPYLVMEYLPGGTLKQKMGRKLPFREAARTIIPVARALAYAHRRKIIHRDIKPANILLTEDGEPMLTDFGIAKTLEEGDQAGLTRTGVFIGTPEYMAPEQGLGKPIDDRVDIYALGVVLYELVTGIKPFTGDTPMAVMVKHINDPMPNPREFLPELPVEVEQVIMKSLAKNPDERYQDMDNFADALEQIAHGKLEMLSQATVVQNVRVDSAVKSVRTESVPAVWKEEATRPQVVQTPVPKKKRLSIGWIIAIVAGGSGLLCAGVIGFLAIIGALSETTSTPTPTVAVSEGDVLQEPTENPTETVVTVEVVEPTQTRIPQPTFTSSIGQQATPGGGTGSGEYISEQFFIQEETSVLFWFMVENPNTTQALENSQFSAVAYDAVGNQLDATNGYVGLLLPEQQAAVAGTIYLSEGQTATRVDLSFSPGEAVTPAYQSMPFYPLKTAYFQGSYSSEVMATIQNELAQNVTDIYVSAVLYDAAGSPIGGGYTYLDFLLAEGDSAVSIPVSVDGSVESIEVYALFTTFTELVTVPDELPVVLGEMGGIIGDYTVEVTFFVENTLMDLGVEDTLYQVGVYDADGAPIGASSGYIDTIFPGESQAVHSSVYLTDSSLQPSDFTVEILSGDPVTPEYDSMPFWAENVVYDASGYSEMVRGTIVNPFDQSVVDLKVIAVCFDANGKIVGGGYIFTDEIPANGSLDVEIYVTVSQDPTRVELYPAFSAITEFEGN